MAITSWTFLGDTAFVDMTTPTDITVNDASFTLTMPAARLAANGPYMESTWYYLYALHWLSVFNGATSVLSNLQLSTSTKVKKNNYAAAAWNTPTATLATSNFFNSNNPNDRTVALAIKTTNSSAELIASDDHQGSQSIITSSQLTFGTINLTLDVPPTATVSAISYDTGYIYAGLTTASVTISDAAAYYGGTIASVKFTIGNQTATGAGNGTLSIALNAGGTFTPTVTITDSRGQTYTKTYAPITVEVYTEPSVSFNVERTDASGALDDEGTYGLIEATLTFSDAVATAQAPSVVLTDENGTQTTPVVTWYTDDTLATVVTWANVSSGDTVYGLVPGINTQYSYQVSVRPRDSEGTGTAVTETLSSAFYTVDFLAGGHGIAFGKPAGATGFECAMATTFENTVDVDGNLTCGADVLIDLPDYQTAGTTDKAIYDAIVALGWDSEVIV